MMTFSALVAIVVGLTEVAKKAGLSSRYAPILSIVIGLILSVIANTSVLTAQEVVMTGLVIGLTSSGFYSSVKKTVLNK